MPFLKLHVPAGIDAQKKSALVSEAHQAFSQALKADPAKGQVVLYESPESERKNAPGRPLSFVFAEVSLWAGRSDSAKEEFMAALSGIIKKHLGTPESEIQVILYESEKRHWAIGGKPANKL